MAAVKQLSPLLKPLAASLLKEYDCVHICVAVMKGKDVTFGAAGDGFRKHHQVADCLGIVIARCLAIAKAQGVTTNELFAAVQRAERGGDGSLRLFDPGAFEE